MKNIKISFFNSIVNPDNSSIITLEECINLMTSNKLTEISKTCRENKQLIIKGNKEIKSQYDKVKKELPCVIFQGEFSKRCKDGLINKNQLIAFDIDNLENIDYVKDKIHIISEDKHIVFTYITPSGNGLKIILNIPCSIKEYPNAWLFGSEYLARKYDLHPDESCKDIGRAHFICHIEPNEFFVNYDAEPLNIPKDNIHENITYSSEGNNLKESESSSSSKFNYIKKVFDESCEEIRNCEKGKGNDTLNKKSFRMGQFSHYDFFCFEKVSEAFIDAYLSRGNHSVSEARNTIKSGWDKGIMEPRYITYKKQEIDKIKLESDISKMDIIDFELRKKEYAEKYGITVSSIDKINNYVRKKEDSKAIQEKFDLEPWEEPINALELYLCIKQKLKSFVIADDVFFTLAPLWIMMTYFSDEATIMPMAMITAPESGCGKSVALQVFAELVNKPEICSNISPSAIYRVIELEKPTLLLDEADTYMKNNEDIRGILNSGHTRKNAYIIRCENDKNSIKPVIFSTWCPKVIAGIRLDSFNNTLTSRSIIFRLRRKHINEKTESIRHVDDNIFIELRRKILRFANDNKNEFQKLKPILPKSSNRDADNFEPLLAIAEIIDKEIYIKACDAAHEMINTTDDDSEPIKLLKDIKQIITDNSYMDFLPTNFIIKKLIEFEESPWKEYINYLPLTPRRLAYILKGFGIKSYKNTKDERKRGYSVKDFQDAFNRYLPSEEIDSNIDEINDKPNIINKIF